MNAGDALACADCETPYEPGQTGPPCRECGSRVAAKPLDAAVTFRASLGMKARRPGLKGFLVQHVQRSKIAGKTGWLAREVLRIDRSDPIRTVKTHLVEELQPDGRWKVEHDERVEYPSARRRTEGEDAEAEASD
jgi:DNA-directed RNA polymerase subunit RPC12/RpoP